MRIILTLIAILFFAPASFAQAPDELDIESPQDQAQVPGTGEDSLYKDASILEATEGSNAEPITFDADKATATPHNGKAVNELTAETPAEKDDLKGLGAYMPFNGVDFDTLNNNVSSMFFTREQLDLLYSKIRKFKLAGNKVAAISGSDSAGTATSTNANGEEVKYTYITVYLSSIVYPSDGDWTIWINDQKVRREHSDSNDTGLQIVSVNQNSANIIYVEDVKKLSVNSPQYKTKLKRVTAPTAEEGGHVWDYVSADNSIKLESSTGTVQVKLRLGQTFSLYDMEIKEGRYQPAAPTGTAVDPNAATNDLGTTNEMFDVGQAGTAGPNPNVPKQAIPAKQEAPVIPQLTNMKQINDEIASATDYDYAKDPLYQRIVSEVPSSKPEMDQFADSINSAAARYHDKMVAFKATVENEGLGQTVAQKADLIKTHSSEFATLKMAYDAEVKQILKNMLVRFPPVQSAPAETPTTVTTTSSGVTTTSPVAPGK